MLSLGTINIFLWVLRQQRITAEEALGSAAITVSGELNTCVSGLASIS